MIYELNRRLLDLKEQKFRYNKAERRREELLKRLSEQERLVVTLELKLESEQADVDKLTRMSLTNLFHTILRSKEEQLEMERQQALHAALKLNEAKQMIEDTKDELISVGDDLTNYRNAETEYYKLMAEKETILRNTPLLSGELAVVDEQIEDQTILVKEIHEAVTAGKRVLNSLEFTSSSLEKAENWGKWDLWGGGGMISTHLKHNHIDDAKNSIHNANRLILDFRNELTDLNRQIDINIDISEMLKMADYWFDGLIADWIVQDRIENSQKQTLEAMHKIRTVINQLESELRSAETSPAGMKAKRTAWVEESGIE